MKRKYSVLPEHIAIIMDGNGRWAKQKGMARTEGHKAGERVFGEISRYCAEIGIKYVTFYAFSTENWKRSEEEVSAIMDVFRGFLHNLRKGLTENGKAVYRLRFIGGRDGMPEDIAALMNSVEEMTSHVSGTTVTVAMNYGSRDEILRAVRKIAVKIKEGSITPDEITESTVCDALDTAGIPDPDLIIRSGSEHRLSNFLLWQSAYAEILIDDKLWPDYTFADIDRAIEEFGRRNRRFGSV